MSTRVTELDQAGCTGYQTGAEVKRAYLIRALGDLGVVRERLWGPLRRDLPDVGRMAASDTGDLTAP